MNRTRIVFGVVGALVIVMLVMGGTWFWSLGSVHASAPPRIRVETVKPTVELRHEGTETWESVSGTLDLLAGDRIRTGESGEAKIVWGDRGYTRIESGSEIAIETAPLDGEMTPGTKIKLRVESGRVWSRMLKLLDIDSSVEVGTSDVVATVRGTTFGIGKLANGTEAAVTESVIAVRDKSGREVLLRDNQWGSFDAKGSVRVLRDLRPEDAWAMMNKIRDAAEDKLRVKELRDRFERFGASLEGAPGFLVDASEVMHLRIARAPEREKLAAAYAQRRLARAVTETRAADWDAFRRYATYAGDLRGTLLGTLHVAAALQDQTRGLRSSLLDPGLAAAAYLDGVVIDEAIDVAILGDAGRDQEQVKELRDRVDAYAKRVNSLSLNPIEQTALQKKVEALRKRLEYLGTLPLTQEPTPPPTVRTQVTKPIQGTQIQDEVLPPPSILQPAPSQPAPTPAPLPTPTPTPPAKPSLSSIAFQFVGPTTLSCSSQSAFKIIATYSDGHAADVTISSSETVSNPRLIYVNNSTVYSFCTATVDTSDVTATYAESGVTKTATVTITVTPEPQPASSGCSGRQGC